MKIIIRLTLMLLICINLQGQSLTSELISSSGGFIQGSSASLSFSIGECITESFSGSNGELSQGFQQTFDIVTSIDVENSSAGIHIYPVPAVNSFFIEIGSTDQELTATLINIDGYEIFQVKLNEPITEITLGSLPSGNYILNVKNLSETISQSFKIVKH